MLTYLLALTAATAAAQSVSSNGFCTEYVSCMAKLEEKQRECMHIDQNITRTSVCAQKVHSIKVRLDGLHMRRAEIAHDCALKFLSDAALAESVLDEKQKATCDAVKSSWLAPGAIRQKRASKSEKVAASSCRSAAKALHSSCSALAKCCPIALDCAQQWRSVMDEIRSERDRLQAAKRTCRV